MKRFYFFSLLIVIGLFTAQCKKEETRSSDADMALLEARLPGNWDLIAVEYSGFAPNPIDSNQQYPFSGSGTEVSGYFEFTADPNMLDFEMNWNGQVDFGGGTTGTIPVTEKGTGDWEVVEEDYQVVGDVWGMNGANDTMYVAWNVLENTPTKQVWKSKWTVIWDGFNIPIIMDLEATFIKQ